MKVRSLSTPLLFVAAIALFVIGLFFPQRLYALYRGTSSPLVLSATSLDFGTIPVGNPTTRTVSAFNRHLTPIRIDPDCGCSAILSVNPTPRIAPLHRGDIRITITPTRDGKEVQSFLLATNQGEQPCVVRWTAVTDGQRK